MIEKDTYQTIKTKCVGDIYKDKRSKFIGVAFPFNQTDSLNHHLSEVKNKFKGANHYCYAYRIGAETYSYKVNDDGEPRHSAGSPILGQIESFKLTNILVIVVRYYGGINLGVGGLISAYKNAASNVLNNSNIISKTVSVNYRAIFNYPKMSLVMQLLNKHQANISKMTQNMTCEILFSVRKNNSVNIENALKNINGIEIEKL